MQLTPFKMAMRYVGIKEVPGTKDNPIIVAMLKLDSPWYEHDEIAWCSAFCNWIIWHFHLPRSKSPAARSWLGVGRPIDIIQAEAIADVVIFKRGGGNQPGPEIIDAPGHVGFYAYHDETNIYTLGGNQNNMVNVSPFPFNRLLGVRRLE